MASKRLTAIPARLARNYHSTSYPPPPSPFTPLESRILAAANPHIPTHGFTQTSLVLGATSTGYLPASTNLFPRGAVSLVHWHLYTQREALKKLIRADGGIKDVDGEVKELKGVGARVKALTWARLMANEDIVHRWQEGLSLLATPSSIPLATRELALLADEIWYLAGDVSVDTAWYTKRASLGAIYAATEVFMTADKSPGYKDTMEFLGRRFEDSRMLGQGVRGLGQWVGWGLKGAVGVARSKGARI